MEKYSRSFFRVAAFVVLCIFLLAPASCGGGDEGPAPITGPGLVGLDDTSSNTAPLLSVA